MKILIDRLRLHAHELTHGGANASQLRKDLLEAAKLLDGGAAPLGGLTERKLAFVMAVQTMAIHYDRMLGRAIGGEVVALAFSEDQLPDDEDVSSLASDYVSWQYDGVKAPDWSRWSRR